MRRSRRRSRATSSRKLKLRRYLWSQYLVFLRYCGGFLTLWRYASGMRNMVYVKRVAMLSLVVY